MNTALVGCMLASPHSALASPADWQACGDRLLGSVGVAFHWPFHGLDPCGLCDTGYAGVFEVLLAQSSRKEAPGPPGGGVRIKKAYVRTCVCVCACVCWDVSAMACAIDLFRTFMLSLLVAMLSGICSRAQLFGPHLGQ